MAKKKSSTIISVVVGAVIVIAAIVSIFMIDWKTEPPAEPPTIRPLKTMVIGSSVTRGVRQYPGRVQAAQRVDLAFRVSGPLVDLPVNEGDDVNEGDLIARIDPRDFEIAYARIQSSLDEATASLEAMRSGRPEDIEKLRAEVQKAEAALTLARSEYDRAKAAHANGAVSDIELARKLQARDNAEAVLRQAQENLNIGEAGARPEDIEAAEARVRGMQAQRDDAQAALDDTELRAPFTGKIASRFVENFQYVQVREPVVSLQDVTNVEIVINVPEIDVVNATKDKDGGYAIYATFESLPDRQFDVEPKEFATEADPATQTFAMTLTMPAPDPTDVNILPGMTATITALPKNPETTGDLGYVVPIDAVPIDETGQYYVWVVRSATGDTFTVHRMNVTPGNMMGEEIVIVEGLSQRDEIATAGVHLLREGQVVRRYTSEREDSAS